MNEEKKAINVKRFLSGILLFPIIACILVFANNLVMDITIAVIALISVYEYCNCFKISKKANPSQWLASVISILIIFAHMINDEALNEILILVIPISILILTIELLFSHRKKNIIDAVVTIFGICYIPLMMLFLSSIRGNFIDGKILIWYVFFSAWGSDIFAYLIGKNFGKHKLTSISKNKTIEGALAGVFGAVILSLIYTFAINSIYGIELSYIMVAIITMVLSIIGQIGDLAASSVKRYCEVKDFSELIPGHGGMLDRIDSVIFIAPFAYILLGLLI